MHRRAKRGRPRLSRVWSGRQAQQIAAVICDVTIEEGSPGVLGPGEPEEARQDRHDRAVEGGCGERQAVRPAKPQVQEDEQRKEHRDLVHLQQMHRRLLKGLQHGQPSACHGNLPGPSLCAMNISLCSCQPVAGSAVTFQ